MCSSDLVVAGEAVDLHVVEAVLGQGGGEDVVAAGQDGPVGRLGAAQGAGALYAFVLSIFSRAARSCLLFLAILSFSL